MWRRGALVGGVVGRVFIFLARVESRKVGAVLKVGSSQCVMVRLRIFWAVAQLCLMCGVRYAGSVSFVGGAEAPFLGGVWILVCCTLFIFSLVVVR